MLTTATRSTRPLPISLRPAEEAYDYESFRARLAEPAILADAVAVRIFRAPLLAVPTGGARRGGYMSFDLLPLAVGTRDLLAGRPGFPDLRVRWSADHDACHTVEWGDPAPRRWEDDALRGRFYGYSEDAIAAFLRGHPQTPSSVTSDSCSPTAS
ncbi:DUF6302 family protein [Streptomyces colonosanans]|uniref:Uncharacterized protein n=1 Tax=Streptomyces colonosanans TaxID=1428652 RepID=A0A1S2NY66_9ACTN|nr:DUF6302 family protein [Streptomyces colonosanans]OIJ86419.1 hypothetical protein BIV24_26540 [Streptomyces colonosanans]